jgi:hypothetical protein
MKLTGKCKEDFEKWYIVIFLKHSLKYYESTDKTTMEFVRIDLKTFYTKNESMQYGVYVDFFDSVGNEVSIIPTQVSRILKFTFEIYSNRRSLYPTNCVYDNYKTRPEARTAAVEKADEIYNK